VDPCARMLAIRIDCSQQEQLDTWGAWYGVVMLLTGHAFLQRGVSLGANMPGRDVPFLMCCTDETRMPIDSIQPTMVILHLQQDESEEQGNFQTLGRLSGSGLASASSRRPYIKLQGPNQKPILGRGTNFHARDPPREAKVEATTAFPGMIENGPPRLDARMMIPDQLERWMMHTRQLHNRSYAKRSDYYSTYTCEDSLIVIGIQIGSYRRLAGGRVWWCSGESQSMHHFPLFSI
jgi:hypothetical protein